MHHLVPGLVALYGFCDRYSLRRKGTVMRRLVDGDERGVCRHDLVCCPQAHDVCAHRARKEVRVGRVYECFGNGMLPVLQILDDLARSERVQRRRGS
jgi:hypothetical protein